MFRYMDIYCERLDPSFWAEPLNAISNLAFLIAAFFAFRFVQKAGSKNIWDWVLVGLIAAMGIGSFLFHTFAVLWAMLTDVIPITLFIYVYICLALSRFFKLKPLHVAAGFAALVAFDFLVIRQLMPPSSEIPWANGSQDYAFPLFAFFVFLPIMAWQKNPHTKGLLGATLLFMVSLTFRTIDHAVCDSLAIGTHYVWHILNAILLYLLTVLIVRAKDVGDSEKRSI